MKTFYLFLVIFVAKASFGHADDHFSPVVNSTKSSRTKYFSKPLTPTLVAAPVAFYPFNGNADDEIGTLDGTVSGATLTKDRSGIANSAYLFDGLDDFIETANVATTNQTNWALSAWISPTVVSQLGAVVTNGYDNTLNAGAGYSIHLNDGAGHVGNTLTGAFDGFFWYNSGMAITTAETWYHVVLANIDGATQLYANGVATPNSTNGGGYAPIGSVLIGAQNGGRFFNGAIDEVKIFDVGLTAADALAEYESSKPLIPEIPSMVGSGKALQFDGVDDYVTSNAYLVPNSGDFTVDFWVKNSSVSGIREFISQGAEGDAFYIGTSNSTGEIRCGDKWVATGAYMPLDKWIHLALVKSGTDAFLFQNGVQVASISGYSISSAGDFTSIGRQYGVFGEYPDAILDEIRIWNMALSEAEIRERMCRKITTSDSRFGNLLTYYNFDQEDATTLIDVKSVYNGTLMNGPTWTTSGAAIGDASAFTYGGASVSLAHQQGESLTVSNFVGTPAGVHLYVVNSAPNSTNGIEGVGSNNRYFGVFHFGSPTLTYITSYNYENSPYVNSSNESGLTLYKRDNNADPTWEIGGLPFVGDPNIKIISVISFDSEYMLGSTSAPLPVRLVSFDAQPIENGKVKVSWTTAGEQNASHFVVERSFDAKVFSSIGKVDAVGNTTQSSKYLLTDESPFEVGGGANNIYYRLKQLDIDGKQTIYRTVVVRFNEGISQFVYPNPVSEKQFQLNFTGSIPNISLTDINGKGIDIEANQSSFQKLTIKAKTPLKPGLYILQTKSRKESQVHKVVVH